jgi:N-acetylglucosamine-6-phosphate deacetylase
VVLVEGGRIADIVAPSDPRCSGARTRDLAGAMLLPASWTCRSTAAAGSCSTTTRVSRRCARSGAAHRRFGTTSFLPTLISDDLPVVRAAIGAVREAIAAGVPGVAGVHLEGPFLSAARKGTHDAGKFRDLDADAVALLTSLDAGRTLVTLAPEETTPQTLERLARAGVILSAGHTNATYAQMREALDHGVRGFTHLFNAMSPFQHRAPGVVGAALHHRASWCGLIVDGHHVDPVALQLALRCKPHDRFMLVTDAMASVGADRDDFLLQGKRITVRDGRCIDESGVLSGSALDMASAVRNAVAMLEVPLAEAVRMASTYPAEFLGLGREIGRIAPGYRADLVAAGDDLAIHETWIAGRASRE